MKCFKQKGFTLVELMIVISIIGILAVALATQVTKIQESARAAKCKANLKALAQAVQTYGTSHGRYPEAGSYEWEYSQGEWKDRKFSRVFRGEHGWVAWTEGNSGTWPWAGGAKESRASRMKASTFIGDKDAFNTPAYISLTNGVLWGLVGKDASVYVCDRHKHEVERQLKGKRVYRSYVMNAWFHYDIIPGKAELRDDNARRHVDDAIMDGRAAVRLMFAELPAQDFKTDTQSADSALEYGRNVGWKDNGRKEKEEVIGFNHLIANRWVAHVAFLDGHVEGLVLPQGTMKDGYPNYDDEILKDLTNQLCEGQEIESKIREKMR